MTVSRADSFDGAQPHVPRERYAERRRLTMSRLGPDALVLSATPIRHKSGDSEYRYRPESNLYYLSGLAEPETVLLLRGGVDVPRVVAFVRPRDPAQELWGGLRMGVDEVRQWLGADACYPIDELEARLPGLLAEAPNVYHRLGGDTRVDALVHRALAEGPRRAARSGTGLLGLRDPSWLLDQRRLVKDPDEIALLRRAAEVTVSGFEHALSRLRPSRGEWEVEADLEWAFRSEGAFGPGFGTIVASAERACILHYTENSRRISSGDLVLLDAGAELGFYSGDVTRTVPASGRFTTPQLDAYTVVLEAQRAAIDAARPSATLDDVHQAALRALVSGLVDLGVLSGTFEDIVDQKAHLALFPHKTSHWLGLDVHDVGPYVAEGSPTVLEPGMVLTVEPGLYLGGPGLAIARDGAVEPDIPEGLRGIGIRIEDDIVITSDGCEVLTGHLPKTPEELVPLLGSA